MLTLAPTSTAPDFLRWTSLGSGTYSGSAQTQQICRAQSSKSICRKVVGIRETMPVYWRRLIELGVPIDEAKAIAWIIVRYDAGGILPTLQQQQILRQYCRFICRARLWRSELLFTTPTRQSPTCSYLTAPLRFHH